MRKKKNTKSQPRIKGIKRMPTHTSILPDVEDAVDTTARKFGVTKSWVRAVALAQYFGIDTVHYDENVRRRSQFKVVGSLRRQR